jgi:serine phosphatase RsbU (regulator of sigma subunit)
MHRLIIIFHFLFFTLLTKVEAQVLWSKPSADSFLHVIQTNPNRHLLGFEIDNYFQNRLKNKDLFNYLITKTANSKGKDALFVHTLILEQMARQYYIRQQKDTIAAWQYYEKIEKMLKEKGFSCESLEVWISLADEITQIKLDSALARKILMRSYERAEKSKCYNALIRIEYTIGVFLGERYGNYLKSLEHLLKATDLIEKYGSNITTKISIFHALGSLFYKAGNYDKALRYWLEVYDFYLLLKEEEKKYLRFSTARLLNNIGLIYKNKEQYETALTYYKKSIEAAKQVKDTFWMNLPKGNIGDILLRQNKLDSANLLFRDYLNNAYKYQDWGIVVAGYTKIANYHYLKKNYAEAEEFLEVANKILLEKNERINSYNPILTATSQRNIWQQFSQIETAKGNYKTALAYQTKYIKVNDSINKLIGAQQLELLAIDYQIRQESMKKKLLQDDVRQKEYFVIASSTVTLISLILGAMLFINRQKLHKQKNLLEEKNEEIALINQTILLKNKDIMDSIFYAERIQKAFLPYDIGASKILQDYFVLYKPRDIVSGDFYYVVEQKGLIFMIVGDCTGHGVPGALMSMLGVTLLDQIIIEKKIHKPAEIIKALDKGVIKALHQEENSSQDGMDISVCVWNPKNRELKIAGAKSSVILLHYDHFEEIKTDRYMVGGIGEPLTEKNFQEYERSIAPNTMLYLFTDGYLDQFDDKGHKKIGKKRFFNLLLQYHQKPSLQQKHQLQSFLQEWQGKEDQIDDITVLGVRLV